MRQFSRIFSRFVLILFTPSCLHVSFDFRSLAKNQGDIAKTNQLLEETGLDAGIALDLLKCVQRRSCSLFGELLLFSRELSCLMSIL